MPDRTDTGRYRTVKAIGRPGHADRAGVCTSPVHPDHRLSAREADRGTGPGDRRPDQPRARVLRTATGGRGSANLPSRSDESSTTWPAGRYRTTRSADPAAIG